MCLAACAGSGGAPRIDVETLPSQLGCADDADADPANGVQFRVGVVARGEGSAEYERFAIENSTTDVVIEGVFVDGVGEGLQSFAYSHNRVFAYAFDDDEVLPMLVADDVNVVACCGSPCRE